MSVKNDIEQVQKFLQQAQYKEAEKLAKQVLQKCSEAEDTVIILEFLSTALRMTNKLKEAENVLLALVHMLENMYNENISKNIFEDNTEREFVLQNLALIQIELNKAEDAVKNSKKAVIIIEEKLKKVKEVQEINKVQEDLADALIVLSSSYYETKDLSTSRKILLKTLDILKKISLETSFSASTCHNNLGRIYEQENDFENAVNSYNIAIDMRKKINAKQTDIAFCIGNLGAALASLGKFQEAITALEETIAIYTKNGLGKTPYIEAYFHNLNICKRALARKK